LVAENEKAWHPLGVHLGYLYDPSPIVIPDGTPRPDDDPIGYEPTAFPGARAPHVWLGPGCSILDLFGSGFTLLAFGDADPSALDAEATRQGMPLATHRIADPAAAALYAAPLVLVRPDGHVAWRGEGAGSSDARAIVTRVRGAA
jgi:hypothetical protein